MNILLIYNPKAGFGRAKKLLTQVQEAFRQKSIYLNLRVTERPQHAIEIVREVDFSQFDGIIAAGGDGTLFEVVNGYFQNGSSKRIPVGVLPTGTGNSFAQELNISSATWPEAVDIIKQHKIAPVDVGYFTAQGIGRYFVNILGLGFVTDVLQTANQLKIFGKTSYTLGVLYKTLFLKSYHISLNIDGRTIEQDNLMIEISNTRYTGGNFLMAPKAKYNDGLLDITFVGKISRRRLLYLFTKIFSGEHIFFEEVQTLTAKKIIIQTDTPKIFSPDGELLGSTPLEIECLPKAINMFVR